MADLADILRVYNGSDGDATKALFERLEAIGPVGIVAMNLFRASKNSARAKVYRGGGYRGKAYDRKSWAIDNLAKVLGEHGAALGLGWGWGEDPAQSFHRDVLYVELPTGQVSFHTAPRGAGPAYASPWDGVKGAGAGRICSFCTIVLNGARPPFPPAPVAPIAAAMVQGALL
jgi:hypothetical protein